MKVLTKTTNFVKYLNEAEANWQEFGMNAGEGVLSYVSSVHFMNDYELNYNKFGTIDSFFIGVYAISMNRNKQITISV